MSETANKFKIQVFNSSDPQAQYDAVTVKDQKTLYLLDMADGTAKAYLGYKPLAGGGGSNTVMGRLRETVFDAETATSDTDLWGPNASITTVENHKYYTFSSPSSGGATASNPLYSTIMLSKPLAGFDELVLTINNTGLSEVKIPVSHLLHSDWCGIIQDDFTSGILTDVSYEYNETDGPRLKFRMRSTLVINITTIEVVKYQEARVGRKMYELLKAPAQYDSINGIYTGGHNVNITTGTVSAIGPTDWSYSDIDNYDELFIVICTKTDYVKYLYTIPVSEIRIAGLYSSFRLNGLDVCFDKDSVTNKINSIKLCSVDAINCCILSVKGVKYETVTSDPITESYLRTLIDDIVSSKYVEYSIDNGTTQENESAPVTNES